MDHIYLGDTFLVSSTKDLRNQSESLAGKIFALNVVDANVISDNYTIKNQPVVNF